MKPWTVDNPGWIERVSRRLVGIHAGLGDSARAVVVARDAEVRRPVNWLIPGLGFFYAVALILFHRLSFDVGAAGGSMIFRIFVFDYTLFLFAGVSGYNMARKWRANADQVEELSLSPLPPKSVAAIMSAGSCTLWLRAFAVLAVLDLFTGYLDAKFVLDSLGRLGTAPLAAVMYALLGVVSMVACPLVLEWFHFESARLAHWMFASHSLPRMGLGRAGAVNFVGMSLIVLLLSAVGSIVTVTALAPLSLVAAAVETGHSARAIVGTHTGWALASIPGLLAIIWLKRAISSMYAASFVKTWLLYQWWGAGESRQPPSYPASFHKALPYWTLVLSAQEESEADVPPARRKATRRLEAFGKNVAGVGGTGDGPSVSEDRSSGSPARSPDPRNAPSRAPESADAAERNSGSP